MTKWKPILYHKNENSVWNFWKRFLFLDKCQPFATKVNFKSFVNDFASLYVSVQILTGVHQVILHSIFVFSPSRISSMFFFIPSVHFLFVLPLGLFFFHSSRFYFCWKLFLLHYSLYHLRRIFSTISFGLPRCRLSPVTRLLILFSR